MARGRGRQGLSSGLVFSPGNIVFPKERKKKKNKNKNNKNPSLFHFIKMLLPVLHSVSNVLVFMRRHITEYT